LNKLFHCTVAAAALLGLAACTSAPKQDKVIAAVAPGLTQIELVERVGPPDSEYEYAGHDCFQYALDDKNSAPLAVYFDDQKRVMSSARAGCKGRMR
jgi:hypothetical protein